MPLFDHDMHVHSTFSDGAHSVEENLIQAQAVGITCLGCVDHVRKDTTWLPQFIDTVHVLGKTGPVKALACVEAKILNSAGELDLPQNIAGVDYIYAADHQFPLGDRCYTPKDIREMLEKEQCTAEDLMHALVSATSNVLDRYENVVIAHLFSILPKIRLSEYQVPLALITDLARKAKQHGARIEIDERWRCPSLRTLRVFHAAGVPILTSTDSHRKENIGQYRYVKDVIEQLRAA